MQDDPRKYWNNIPREIHASDEDVTKPDVPIDHTPAERDDEELEAEKNAD